MTFQNELDFANYIEYTENGNLYRVGGAVRDKLIGRKPKDIDYVVEGLTELPFKRVGKSFPVYLVEIGGKNHEVALCRQETKTGPGYSGFEVRVQDISIEEDLARRDFTMNAIAEHVISGEIVDPFDGREAIKSWTLEKVGNAFDEDPLRIIRAARFVATFGFNIEANTYFSMKDNAHKLTEITGERLAIELRKVFDNTVHVGSFFRGLDTLGALEYCFPEIAALKVPDKHDGTAFNHVMNLLEYGKSWEMFLMLLAHDLGKGVTDPTKHPSHHGHDNLGVAVAKEMADRLRLSLREKNVMVAASKEHMRIKRFSEMKPSKKIRFVLQYGYRDARNLLLMSFIDSTMREGASKEFENNNYLTNIHHLDVAIEVVDTVDGKYLIGKGVEPGEAFGHRLEQERISLFKKTIAS